MQEIVVPAVVLRQRRYQSERRRRPRPWQQVRDGQEVMPFREGPAPVTQPATDVLSGR